MTGVHQTIRHTQNKLTVFSKKLHFPSFHLLCNYPCWKYEGGIVGGGIVLPGREFFMT